MKPTTIHNKAILTKYFNEAYTSFQDGKHYRFLFEELKQEKTLKQLGFVFGGLISSLNEWQNSIGETMGEGSKERKWTVDDTKIKLYHEVIGISYKQLPDGTITPYTKTLSQMNKEEASDFITKVLTYIDNDTDCILTPDLRYCWLMHVKDDEIQRATDSVFQDRDASYLNHVRSQPCIYCGNTGRSEVHHVKGITKTGLSTKPYDWTGIPLCTDCHTGTQRVQDMTPEVLQGRIPTYGYDMLMFVRLCYLKYYEHR